MAAYAALRSLKFTIEQHQRSIVFPDEFQIESLLETITFLLNFFEHYAQMSSERIAELETETVDKAYLLDFSIESHALDQMLVESGFDGENSSIIFSEENTQEFIEVFDSIKKKAIKIMDVVRLNENQRSRSLRPSGPSRSSQSEENTMVGFDEHLIQVMNQVTSQKSRLQVLPIVGMGGIGKTILARNVYDNRFIKEHFQIRLWGTISQSQDVQSTLLSLLNDLGIVDHQINLGVKLYRTLSGRRYLVVMDDLWSIEVWDMIRRFFPDYGNGSRVIITTRLLNVASHVGSCDPYKLELLNEFESWNLLKEKVFMEDGWPSTLEEIGRKIAVSCNGLPLAIVVIAGQLAKSDMTKESWENVAGALNSIINSENDDQCLKILSLSYDSLPIYLKPCFLMGGVFPENSTISVSGLVKLWIAEGFLKPVRGKCLEDSAVEYLTDLVERNLILVSERGSSGKMKHCRIHDLLRDLCLRKAHEHNFLYSRSFHRQYINNNPGIKDDRGYSLDLKSTRSEYLDFTTFELVRKWDSYAPTNLWHFRVRCTHLSGAGVLDVFTCSTSLASLPMFRNLQTLIMTEIPGNEPVILPPQIWEMPLLRHLYIQRVVLSDPPTGDTHANDKKHCVLENMQTLKYVHSFKLTEEVLKRIPNLRKLKLTYMEVCASVEWPCYYLDNLVHLHKLESLSCSINETISITRLSFPLSLKKLTLDCGQNPWEDMTVIGSLPNLEVLRLQNDAFCGRQWRPVEGEFCRLKTLHLRNLSLEHWEADNFHFPRLERLIFYNVWKMMEIPPSIGDITTLQFISLELCSTSLLVSAKLLMEEQQSLENNGIQFHWPMQETIELMPYFLNFLLQSNNNHVLPDSAVQLKNLEYDLRRLNQFLNYTTKNGRKDKKLNDLASHIEDTMYEAKDIVDTIWQSGTSLTNSLRRLLFIAKEVEYLGVSVQRILLNTSANQLYEEPTDLVNITKNGKPLSSGNKGLFRNFASLTVQDGISEDNEMVVMHKEFGGL